jgi:hypothetical protein
LIWCSGQCNNNLAHSSGHFLERKQAFHEIFNVTASRISCVLTGLILLQEHATGPMIPKGSYKLHHKPELPNNV